MSGEETRTVSPWIADCTFFSFASLMDPHDLARHVGGEPVLDLDHLAHARAGRGLDLAGLEVLERHLAPHQLALQHVPDRLELVLVGRGERDLLLLLVELDGDLERP